MYALRRLLISAFLVACSGLADAHKSSDAYLSLQGGGDTTTLRIDVALRDLDMALDLDGDGDGRLTWREIRSSWPKIENYVKSHIDLSGCKLTPISHLLERRADGVYAALILQSPCRPVLPPTVRYGIMSDVDPTHRGIARIEWTGQSSETRILVPESLMATASPTLANNISATQFIQEGVRHILTGYDHVLFLICLLLPSVVYRTTNGWHPVDRLKVALLPVIKIVTAFTAAHSITLTLAATGVVALSPAFIEPAIAVTIMLAALDNIWPIFFGRRTAVAFFFGLIHGFGFASVLAELNLPTTEFAWALFQFNVGIEIGQLAIVSVLTIILFALRTNSSYPLVVVRGGSIVAILIALAWFIERVSNISLLAL